ncbi:flagellar associated protein [Strigomonas culicis]|uniref:Flagellar associated protein n=1 Tax=Strigomonas culicis TaxID=28005 RepID=S9VMQ5_9TRYP|nr:flagellar associated protein [Strigomonas culicis]|eukprot:EPY24520.1 flagellar associated protein [Strigomonas culicis]
MSKSNPFVVPSTLDEASRTQEQRQQAAAAANLFSSRVLKEEIRHDDAEMIDDVAALRCRKGFTNTGVTSVVETAVLDINDNMTTEQFILKKREVGLIRMSLEAKKKEIRKLEEEADRAEKKLHQQQSQLESTREKFNNFLKQSNLEQDVAVRRADEETRAKTEKTVEIKKLSAQIARVELDMKKTEGHIENCLSYKRFLGDLTKPKWFQDVLTSLRIDDEAMKILLEAEARFLEQVQELQHAHEMRVQAEEAEQEAKLFLAPGGRKTTYKRASEAVVKKERQVTSADQKPVEQQIEELHAAMEHEVQARVTEMEQRVIAEVAAMPPEQVRQAVDTQYDESRVPPYFDSVDDLLEVFISVEEGNLFLIQNCQELEEELEEVAMQFMQEKQEMHTMTQQRQAQMEVLAEKIRVAEEKLHQLVDRDQALDTGKREVAKSTAPGAPAQGAMSTKRKAEEAAAVELPPELFKNEMEKKIGNIFRTLTTGDTAIKNTLAR